MLRMLASFVKGSRYTFLSYNRACLKAELCFRNLNCQRPDFISTCQYGTKPLHNPFVEEETLSHRVLEHMRKTPVYSTIANSAERQIPISNAFDDKEAIKQLLLVIAHGPEAKVNDILQLFYLYATSPQYVTNDIISSKPLMKKVSFKVMQSLSMMKLQDLQQLALSIKQLRFQRLGYMRTIANSIATHCEHKALESSLSESLELFDILLILYGNSFYKKKQFETFMTVFEANLVCAQPHDIVQMLHYNGLAKNNRLSREFVNKAIIKLEPNFGALSFSDAGIAVAGIFKTSMNVEAASPLLKKMAQLLKSKLGKSSSLDDLESYGVIAMIKLLRLSRYKDDELVSVLSGFVMKMDEFDAVSPQVIPHILAFYANSQVYHKEIFSKIENVIYKHLQDQSSQIRIRDFTRLLWCFSHTGHACSARLLTEIDRYLLRFIHNSEIAKTPHLLSDSLLSLAICTHYPEDLLKEAFKPEMVEGLKGHQRSKQLSRLVTLHQCLQIEVPDLTVEVPIVSPKDLPLRNLSDELLYRPGLAKLMEGVTFINNVIGAKVFKLKFLLPSINYATFILDLNQLKHSIPVTSPELVAQYEHITQQLALVEKNSQGQSIAIELLDSQFLIKGSPHPIGMIRLKLRLLRKTGWNVKEVLHTEVDECGNDVRALAALLMDKVTQCQ